MVVLKDCAETAPEMKKIICRLKNEKNETLRLTEQKARTDAENWAKKAHHEELSFICDWYILIDLFIEDGKKSHLTYCFKDSKKLKNNPLVNSKVLLSHFEKIKFLNVVNCWGNTKEKIYYRAWFKAAVFFFVRLRPKI